MKSRYNGKSFSYNLSTLLKSTLDQVKAIERAMNQADEFVKNNMTRDEQPAVVPVVVPAVVPVVVLAVVPVVVPAVVPTVVPAKMIVMECRNILQLVFNGVVKRDHFGQIVGVLDLDEPPSLPKRGAPRFTRLKSAWRRVKRVVTGACCIRR
uniref:Uncharacterized protein n=1 Tax=Schizaphis graminum TaxID=13262 RepID=A0A2S2PCX7_SCHGA